MPSAITLFIGCAQRVYSLCVPGAKLPGITHSRFPQQMTWAQIPRLIHNNTALEPLFCSHIISPHNRWVWWVIPSLHRAYIEQ